MDDFEVVERQLGRSPSCAFTVVYRCASEFPVVIENEPYTLEGRPFPTPYWLSCPILRKDISRLEARGMVDVFENDLLSDIQRQSRHLARENKLRVSRSSNSKSPVSVGLTGNRDPLKLKCLHAHTADFLAGELNPTGKTVFDLIQLPGNCRFCNN